MKNINKLIKKYFDETIEFAEFNSDKEFNDLCYRYDYDEAKMFYFADFCENYPDDVLEFLGRQGFDEEKSVRLCELMLTKISNDSDRWLKKRMEQKYAY